MEDNIYGIIVVSLIFVALAFLLTENNAKYLLAGYNTMNEEERNKFNIKSFVRFFKRFHVLLGISMGLIGAFIHYIYSEITEAIFMITYPCLAYVFMVIYSQKYYKK